MSFVSCKNGPSGGTTVQYGTFTTSTSTTTKITLGFKPTYLAIFEANRSHYYNETAFGDSTYIRFTSTITQISLPAATGATNVIASIDADGFTLAREGSSTTAYYFAIG